MSSFRCFAVILLAALILIAPPLWAQSVTKPEQQLEYVVILTRHGVRSPGDKPSHYGRYSALPWPAWNVPPGYLTAHGFELMKLFGAYDRAWLAQKGLFRASGCADAAHVTILADSDERTRATGKALAEGMFPSCGILVHALPEGTHDPLFHSMAAGMGHANGALEVAAIRGRIGGSVNNLTAVYHSQLSALERVLDGCGHAPADVSMPVSLFSIPAALSARDKKVEMRGPLETASSLTENLLLEYTDGMPAASVGWGCVDGATLRSLMRLHIAGEDIEDRTPAVARAGASNLLKIILMAMKQQVTGKVVAGAPGKPGGRLLLLVGHDTNIANVAGVLHLDWILDGRQNDTPPGGALVFELWRSAGSGDWSIRVDYMAQTLEQMRSARILTLANPPARVPVFVPDCGRQDMSCTWPAFATTLRHALQP